MSVSAWIGALLVGLTLGLLGSGGSMLTVPILVYLVGQPDKVAIAGSLAIVGGTAAVGATTAAFRRKIDPRSVVLFGVPSVAGTYIGAWGGAFVSGAFQLLVFALVVLLAAALMLRPGPAAARQSPPGRLRPAGIMTYGLGVGVLTGFVGVGGGFLIVPALVLLGGLPIHLAVGTSLAIVALKSFVGFWKYTDVLREAGLSLDWAVLATFTCLGAVGSFTGNIAGGRVPQAHLRRAFGVFLIVVGGLILWRSLPNVL